MLTKLLRFSFSATTKNPKVFFDININNAPSGRIIFEVNSILKHIVICRCYT